MLLNISYTEWLAIIFAVIIMVLLVVNILTINKLKEDKNRLTENEKLLTQLISQIQNYFSKIDTNIAEVATEEQAIHKMFSMHQKDENLVLKALETNQNMFLDRMDKIVNIQQKLSDKLLNLDVSEQNTAITPEMIKAATTFMITQRKELTALKEQIGSILNFTAPLKQLVETLDLSKARTSVDLAPLENLVKHAQHDLLEVKTFMLENKMETDHSSINEAFKSVEILTQHIDIAKRNIQNVIEQSIDLNPVYKSVHELIEQIKIIFDDYHLAKNEISTLVHTLRDHEHKDLTELKEQVHNFLHDIKSEIKSSVEMLKNEYHLGQNKVTDTVKTLSDRSMASNAYKQNQDS